MAELEDAAKNPEGVDAWRVLSYFPQQNKDSSGLYTNLLHFF